MTIQVTSYLQSVFGREFGSTVHRIVQHIRDKMECGHIPEFDAIACRGTSGLVLAPTVAMLLEKTFIYVRKNKEQSHATYTVEGIETENPVRYLILDDLISSGSTVKTIAEKVNDANPAAICVGAYLYYYPTFYSPERLLSDYNVRVNDLND